MNLSIIERNNQRVLTTAQLAESYGANERRISENFSRNVGRYKEGKHFILLTGEELRGFKGEYANCGVAQNVNRLYLWTEKGAWLHAKSLNTDEAWDAYELLVDEYYKLTEIQPMSPSELALLQAQNMVTLEKEVKEQRVMLEGVANEQKNMAEIIGMTSVQWRKKVTSILNRIANNQGGFEMYRTIRNESYEKLEERGRCKLNIRVLNKQKVMALNGVAKSKVDKVSKLDVIADDARLTEIYLAIVKELAIKYRVNISDVELNETAGG